MEHQTEIKTICPICLKEVKKVKEIETEENRKNPVCINEYYIHTQSGVLIKILNPNTLWS